MSAITIKTAVNSEGGSMRFEFAATRSWQGFAVHGLPSRLAARNGKVLSLSAAIDIWNLSVQSRRDALQTMSVSASIRSILNQARDAKNAASRAQPAPVNF